MSTKHYLTGYALSAIITLTAYLIVVEKLGTLNVVIGIILTLAAIQVIVQLVFFLHLTERGSRWNLMIFVFMVLIVAIVVGGSIWIMGHLNYNLMSPTSTTSLI